MSLRKLGMNATVYVALALFTLHMLMQGNY